MKKVNWGQLGQSCAGDLETGNLVKNFCQEGKVCAQMYNGYLLCMLFCCCWYYLTIYTYIHTSYAHTQMSTRVSVCACVRVCVYVGKTRLCM